MKYYKTKHAGVNVAKSESGKKYVYGTIQTLIDVGIILPDYGFDQNGCFDSEYAKSHWVLIDEYGNSTEFISVHELKESIRDL